MCVVFFLIMTTNLISQSNIEYDYDIRGNRINRKIIVVKLDSSDFVKTNSIISTKYDLNASEETKIIIENWFENITIKVYPNPMTDILNITVEPENNIINDVKLYSIDGKIINQYSSNYYEMKIDISCLIQGAYFIVISVGKHQYQQILIKQ